MSALAAYRGLWTITGPGFLFLAFFARLPAAMGALGALTLIVGTTHSFASGGIVAGALGLGAAFGGPLVGALADRYGQRTVGVTTAIVDALAYVLLLTATLNNASILLIVTAAVVAGFANPQIGPLVRVRWSRLLEVTGRRQLTSTAMAYEGVADEVSYIAGPAIVGLLALTGYSVVPLLGTIMLLGSFGVLFALHPTAAPALGQPVDKALVRPSGDLLGLAAAMACIGVVFGATQTAITAFAASAGHPGAGGLIYAVMGLGSVLAGVFTAGLPTRFGLVARYVCFAAAVLGGGISLLWVDSLSTAMIGLVLLGAAVAPYLITVYALAERISPPRLAGTAMTLVTSGTLAGIAVGAAVAGLLAEAYGYTGAFAVPAVAGCLALLLTIASRRRLSRLVETKAMVAPWTERASIEVGA